MQQMHKNLTEFDMPFYVDGKYVTNTPVNEVLGKPARKQGNFNSTKVVAEEKMREMPITMMKHPLETIPSVTPLFGGYGGIKKAVEKMPVKNAGEGRKK
jgi:hypothetical protein